MPGRARRHVTGEVWDAKTRRLSSRTRMAETPGAGLRQRGSRPLRPDESPNPPPSTRHTVAHTRPRASKVSQRWISWPLPGRRCCDLRTGRRASKKGATQTSCHPRWHWQPGRTRTVRQPTTRLTALVVALPASLSVPHCSARRTSPGCAAAGLDCTTSCCSATHRPSSGSPPSAASAWGSCASSGGSLAMWTSTTRSRTTWLCSGRGRSAAAAPGG